MNRDQIKKRMVKKAFAIAMVMNLHRCRSLVIRCDKDVDECIEIVVPLHTSMLKDGDIRFIDLALIGTDYQYYIQTNSPAGILELSICKFFNE